MSAQVQSNGNPVRETSLRLLKQKMKRALSATTSNSESAKESEKEDNFGSSDSSGRDVQRISPQPPSFPRGVLPELSPGKSHSPTVLEPLAPSSSEVRTDRDSKSAGSVGSGVGDFTALGRAEVGLENLGNTCFMNSALQCLLHIEPLVAFFLQGNIEEHLNLASPKKGNLALSFAQLVREVYRRRAGSSVSPTNLQKAVCAHAPYLMDLQQQDSQEFLRFLLDGIAEDLCRKHSDRDAATMRSGLGMGPLDTLSPQSSARNSSGAKNSPTNKSNNDIEEKPRCSTANPVSRSDCPDDSDSGVVVLPPPSSAPSSPAKDEVESASRVDFSRTAPERLGSAIATLDMHDDAGADADVDAGVEVAVAEMYTDVDADADVDADVDADIELDPFEGDSSSHPHRSFSAGASPTKTNTRPERLRQEARQGRESAVPGSPVRPSGSEIGSGGSGSGSKTPSKLRVRAAVDQSRQKGDEKGEGEEQGQEHMEQGQESSLIDSSLSPTSSPVKYPTHPTHTTQTPDVARIAAVLRNADESDTLLTAETDGGEGRENGGGGGGGGDGGDRGDGEGEGGDERSPTHSVRHTPHRPRREPPQAEDPELAAAPPGSAARRWLLAKRESELQWTRYLKLNDSVITDMFAGQLQSTVECLTCGHRSSTYDPFLDLSVPIFSENEATPPKSFLGSLRHSVGGGGGDRDTPPKSTLEKCLGKFTAEEVLDNENMYLCEKCSTKRKSVKTLSIYKYPQVIQVYDQALLYI
jgi:hypothetical protein